MKFFTVVDVYHLRRICRRGKIHQSPKHIDVFKVSHSSPTIVPIEWKNRGHSFISVSRPMYSPFPITEASTQGIKSFMSSAYFGTINHVSSAFSTAYDHAASIASAMSSAYTTVTEDPYFVPRQASAFLSGAKTFVIDTSSSIMQAITTQIKSLLIAISSAVGEKYAHFVSMLSDLVTKTIASLKATIFKNFIANIDSIKGIVAAFIGSLIIMLGLVMPSTILSYFGRFCLVAFGAIVVFASHWASTAIGFGLMYCLTQISYVPKFNANVNVYTQDLDPKTVKDDFREIFGHLLTCTSIMYLGTTGLDMTNLTGENLDKIMKRHCLLGRSIQMWEKLAEHFSDLIESSLRITMKYVLGKEYISTRTVSDVENMYARVIHLLSLENQLNVGRDNEVSLEIEALYIQWQHLKRLYVSNKEIIARLDTIGVPLLSMWKRVMEKNPKAQAMRKEPVCLLFKGKSGIGKTYLMDALQQDLLKIADLYVPNMDTTTRVYARCHEQEFWDGYTGQPIVIFDDFGQMVDSASNPNPEFFEIIRSVNIFPYSLHSAALADKANNPFSAEFVCLTSNLTNISMQLKSLVEPDAFIRRIHLDITVGLIPAVQRKPGGTGPTDLALDTAKLEAYRLEKNLPISDKSHYTFKFNGESFDYKGLVVSISKIYHKQVESFEQRKRAEKISAEEKLPEGAYSKNERWTQDFSDDEQSTEGSYYDEEEEEEVHRAYDHSQMPLYPIEYSTYLHQSTEVRRQLVQRGNVIFLIPPDSEEFQTFHTNQMFWTVEEYNEWAWDIDLPTTPPTAPYMHILPRNILLRSISDHSFPQWQEHFNMSMRERWEYVNFLGTRYRTSYDYRGSWIRKLAKDFFKFVKEQEWVYYIYTTLSWLNVIVSCMILGSSLLPMIKAYRQNAPNKEKYINKRLIGSVLTVLTLSAVDAPLLNFFGFSTYCVFKTSILASMVEMPLNHLKQCDLWSTCPECEGIRKRYGPLIGEFVTNEQRASMLPLGITHSEMENLAKRIRIYSEESGYNVEEVIKLYGYTPLTEEEVEKFKALPCYKDWTFAPTPPEGSESEQKQIEDSLFEDSTSAHFTTRKDQRHQARYESNPSSAHFVTRKDQHKIIHFEDPSSAHFVTRKDQQRHVHFESEPPRKQFNPNKTEALVDEDKLAWRKQKGKGAPTQTQGLASYSANSIVLKARKNIFLVSFGNDEIQREIGQCMALKGHVAAINRHFIHRLQAKCQDMGLEYSACSLYFRKYGTNLSYELPISEFEATKRDIKRVHDTGANIIEFFAFKLPKQCPLSADIVKHFISKKDVPKLVRGVRVMMPTFSRDAQEQSWEPVNREGNFTGFTTVHLKDATDEHRFFPQSLGVDFSSQNGDCGAPYIAMSDLFPNPLIGLHFAGARGSGNGAFLTQEDLKPFVKEEFCSAEANMISLDYPEEEFPLKDSRFWVLGKIPTPVTGSFKTKLEQSGVYGKVAESTVAPARLGHPLRPDGPMLKALQKNCGVLPLLNEHYIDEACNSYQALIHSRTGNGLEKTVLTFEQACEGIPGNEYMSPIKRSKSAGYPLMLEKNVSGKHKWLGTDVWDFSQPECVKIKNEVEEMEQTCLRGEVPEVYFVDTLKDEKRSIDRVIAGKTRVFAAAPMVFTILFRQYFLGFFAFMARNTPRMECAVGTNAYSEDWQNLVQHLQFPYPQTMIAGDFSNFDGTVHVDIFTRILDIVNDFYRDSVDNQRVRRMLWENIIHSKHILYDIVYQFSHGQPSGNPGTAVTNSIYNSLCVRYVYASIFGSCKMFNTYIRMTAYGDDNIISVHPKIQKEFNAITLTKGFSSIGMTYTSESKGEQTAGFRTIEEVTYLKRGFVCDQGEWIAPLALSSILEMTNWVRKSPSHRSATIENCKAAIAELYYHDKVTFEVHKNLICAAIEEQYGETFPIISWEVARKYIRARRHEMLVPNIYASSEDTVDNIQFAPQATPKDAPQAKPKARKRKQTKYFQHEEVIEASTQGPITQTTKMSQINPLIGDTTTKSISDAVKFTTVGNVEQENHGSSKLFKATRGLYTPAGELPHSIESFLGRPIRVGSFQYSTGSMRGNLAYGCDILTVIKEHPEMKLYRDKLDGFYAMNATAEFKVLVNAQPCEAGQLLLGFIPFSNKYWNDLNIGWGQEIVLPLLSGFNAMDFNIATESEVVYTVPYTGPNPAIQLKYNRGWGTFFISPITPLLAADNVSSCEVVIYLQLKDIELYGITESSTQGLDEDFSSTITKMASSTINETMERGKTIATNVATDLVEDAIGGIPKISDIAGGVAFVAEATQNISKIFGLSKPVADPAVTRVACSPFGQMQNCDGDSTAYKLGATTSQGIKVTPLGLTDADELSFKEIVRAPNYYQYFTWNNTQAPGTKIGRVPVSPNCALWYNSVMYPSRLRFVANYFQFWRGTIIYHFRLSSTKFHSGRLRFVLELGSDNKSVDNVNNPYHFSEIVDIRDGMCIQVKCPFISTKPWRFVPTASNISTGFTNAGYMTVDPSLSTVLDSEVHLGIYVENSLRAPDNVSHSIELATYVSGGEDIEFAGYRDTNHATVANHGGDIEFANPMDKVKWTEAPDGSKDEEPGWDITEAHTQGMLDVPDIAPINIAGLPEQCKVDLTASEMSVGEVFTSFRPLLKRYMSTGTVQKSDKASKPIFGIYPYRTTFSVKSWYNTELLTNLLPLWRFYRGGVRILMVPDRQQGIAKVGYNTYLINEKDVGWDGPSPVQKSTSMSGFGYSAHVSFALSLQGGVELEFPGYTPYACCLFAKQDSLKNYVNAMAHGEVPMGVASVSFPSQVTNVDTYRSVADDFTAGYLMGAPPVIWNIDNSSKANAIDF